MKTLTRFALAAALLLASFTAGNANARVYGRSSSSHSSYGGSSRSSYVYRNPYATTPSVSVRGYGTSKH